MKEREWRAQVTALFEAFERRLDEFGRRLEHVDRRLDQVERRLDALAAQADIWDALKDSIVAEDETRQRNE
jgi:hypothetical protein